MFKTENYTGSLEDNYRLMIKQAEALTADEPDLIANLANVSALLNQFLDRINWVGFYLYKETDDELVLGPFQGLPACVRIPAGRGVCGTAFSENTPLRIADVNQFPGHIACDAASQSEIVVPLVKDGKTIGVLDIDSPITERFTETDEKMLTALCEKLSEHL